MMKRKARDNIADHLALALEYGELAGDYSGQDPVWMKVAQFRGKALGHLFRAAELAYDLGQAHGPRRVVLVLPGRLDMVWYRGTIAV